VRPRRTDHFVAGRFARRFWNGNARAAGKQTGDIKDCAEAGVSSLSCERLQISHKKTLKIPNLPAQPFVCLHFRPRINVINTVEFVQGQRVAEKVSRKISLNRLPTVSISALFLAIMFMFAGRIPQGRLGADVSMIMLL
jgi:hypothetical protein